MSSPVLAVFAKNAATGASHITTTESTRPAGSQDYAVFSVNARMRGGVMAGLTLRG
jgi:hypothetical protein